MKELASTAREVLVPRARLADGLRALGVGRGDVVLVHVSLSGFGMVPGGEQTVLQALREVVGDEGTLVMPAQSWQLCDPDFLDDPAQGAEARSQIRATLPAYDVHLTPTRSMGAVAELFRTQPGTLRSPHPHRSFAAAGPLAARIVGEHPLDDPFGANSPLARLLELDGTVLLLGVGFDKCTALHYAELRSGGGSGALVRNGARLDVDGRVEWRDWLEPRVRSDDFAQLGRALERGSTLVRRATVGAATCRAVRLSDLAAFAESWFLEHRG
jgi:aminoglycoside 3-N-acetyltransferase